MAKTSKPIIVVGSINMDLVTQVHTLPVPGQTLIGTGFLTTPGGKGANQAVAAARLGFPTQMVGMVGEDGFGQNLLATLAAAGVGTVAVERAPGPSGIASILLADNGTNNIVVVSGANSHMDPLAVDRHAAFIRTAGMVLCQLELPPASVARLLAICAQAGVPIMLDPAPAAALPELTWAQATWFTPNETEAAFYLGGDANVEDAAEQFLSKGVRNVALKRGAAGVYVAVAGGRAEWVRPFAVEAVDSVAAGDCFNGAFAVALLEGHDPWAAARFANAAAAISVTRTGAQASMPSRAEVDAFLAAHP
jgi:ribokinase